MNKTTVLMYKGKELTAFNSAVFPLVHVGETLEFEEAYPEAVVSRGAYTVNNIKHVFTKTGGSVAIKTILYLTKKKNDNKDA